ncbi:MAG TPA: DUF1573 domain-containing protein, partial [Anaerolineae bacterium]|nr:DUF1573 domain-containing protein [Anaerolineae bacterium]
GLWLLSGLYPRASRLVAVGCFAAFAAVSLWKVLSGETTCGCLGRSVTVHPWYALVFDTAALAGLAVCRAGGEGRGLQVIGRVCWAQWWGLSGGLAFGLVILLLLAAWGAVEYGSFRAAVASLQGYPILVDPSTRDLGPLPVGGQETTGFTVKNLSRRTVTVTGVQSTCGLRTATRLPMAIPAGGEGRLCFVVDSTREDSLGRHGYFGLVYVDAPSPPIVIRVFVEAVPPGAVLDEASRVGSGTVSD